MTQRTLFAKSQTFRRPRRTVNRWGDKRREWLRTDDAVKIVYTTTICGVSLNPSFKVIALLSNGECLISRHRKLTAAMRAAKRVEDHNQPKPTKRRKGTR